MSCQLKGEPLMVTVQFLELSQIQKQLLLAAEEGRKTSYSPYSRFPVGAALLTNNGDIITGSNFENVSYPCSVCAETAAVVRANSMGERMFQAIAISGGDREEVITPCGSCRQVLFETAKLSGKDIEVILSDPERTKVILTSVYELLPSAFGPDDLRK